MCLRDRGLNPAGRGDRTDAPRAGIRRGAVRGLSLIHISEPTRLLSISYAVFCLKKKKGQITRLLVMYHSRSTVFFFSMSRRPPRSTLSSSSAASDVYKRQTLESAEERYE